MDVDAAMAAQLRLDCLKLASSIQPEQGRCLELGDADRIVEAGKKYAAFVLGGEAKPAA